jgi:hypothetical protein
MKSYRHSSIELHDSTIEELTLVESGIRVELSCVLHLSEGTPGADGGISAVQDAVLLLPRGQIDGVVGVLPAEILDGELAVGAETFANMIRLPCQISGEAVSLTLFLHPDNRRLRLFGDGFEVALRGNPECIEEWSGIDSRGGNAS